MRVSSAVHRLIKELREALAEEDVMELNLYMISELFRYLTRIKARSLDDLKSKLATLISDLDDAYPFPMLKFSADVIRALLNKSSTDELFADLESFRLAIGIASSILREYIAKAYTIASLNLSGILNADSPVFIIGYFNMIDRILVGSKVKIHRVNIVRYWPGFWGIDVAERLVNLGFDVRVWHDSAISHAVESSDYVIIPLWGLYSDGYTVADSGSYVAASLAKEMGVMVLGVVITINMDPRRGEHEKIRAIRIRRKLKLPDRSIHDVDYRRFDIMPSSVYDKIVTDMKIMESVGPDDVGIMHDMMVKEIVDGVEERLSTYKEEAF